MIVDNHQNIPLNPKKFEAMTDKNAKNNEMIKLKINIIINNTAANFFMIFLFLK